MALSIPAQIGISLVSGVAGTAVVAVVAGIWWLAEFATTVQNLEIEVMKHSRVIRSVDSTAQFIQHLNDQIAEASGKLAKTEFALIETDKKLSVVTRQVEGIENTAAETVSRTSYAEERVTESIESIGEKERQIEAAVERSGAVLKLAEEISRRVETIGERADRALRAIEETEVFGEIGADAFVERIAEIVPVVPLSAILAFDSEECPSGWKSVRTLQGRFLLGADGRDYHLGKRGGKYVHALTVDEMPTHNHPGSVGGAVNAHLPPTGRPYVSKGNEYSLETTMTPGLPIEVAGEGQGLPHENMPPYTAYTFCKQGSE